MTKKDEVMTVDAEEIESSELPTKVDRREIQRGDEVLMPVRIDAVKKQVQAIQELMAEVLQEDVHYGKIPGTDKPTLLKAGAEKLDVLFRLAPRYKITKNEIEPFTDANFNEITGHREIEVVCELYHISTGQFVGSGVGSCSTMESKYRYRYLKESTGVPVPKEYWDHRDNEQLADLLRSRGIPVPEGADVRTSKDTGRWEIAISTKGENPDIADVYNTVLKMAKKRAHIDAILTSTAASDIFAQDMEEINSERMDERQQLLQTWHELGYELVGPDSWDTEVADKTARQYGKTPETMTVSALKSAIERMQKALEKKELEEESDDDFEFDPNADDGLPFT